EELRALEALSAAAATLRNPRPVWRWSSATGLVHPEKGAVENTTNPVRALDRALEEGDAGVFVFCDLHGYFGTDSRPGEPAIIRKVRETATEFRQGDLSGMLVITAPVRVIPPELDKLTTLIDFPLPDAATLRALLDGMIRTNEKGPRGIRVTVDDLQR